MPMTVENFIRKIGTAADMGRRWATAGRPHPKAVAMIICPPRTGSTWLLDVLRAHPKVEFWPTAVVPYNHLRLGGNRYPGDLCNGADASYRMENRDSVWVRVPSFDVSGLMTPADLEGLPGPSYAVEKIHPHFWWHGRGDRDARFDRRLGDFMAKGVPFKFIYCVRNPRSTFLSYINYHKRNPAFGAWAKDEALLAANFRKTWACMWEAARRRPGLIVDYGDLKADPKHVLLSLYGFLWPQQNGASQGLQQKVVGLALDKTKREDRAGAGSPFFGQKEGGSHGSEAYERFARACSGDVQACFAIYQKLLDSPQRLRAGGGA